MTGHVKFFKPSERYGIIVPEGKNPGKREDCVFFYEDVLEEGVKHSQLSSGAEVEYELIPNLPWKRALWVRPLNKRTYAPVKEFRSNSTQARGTHAGD